MADIEFIRQAGRRFAGARFSDLDEQLREVVIKWMADVYAGRGTNLVLLGPVGVGKTHAACAAANHAAETVRYDVKFSVVVEMFDDLRPGGPETVESLAEANLLVLDDLGIEKRSEWTDERLYAIVNRRWRHMRPTVVTSNLTTEQMEECVTERVWDRLIGNNAARYWMGGESRRKP